MSYANSPQVIAAVTELFQQNKKNKKKKQTHIFRGKTNLRKNIQIFNKKIYFLTLHTWNR